MNDFNLCYDKKFIANYGYPLYVFKKHFNVWTVTILAISVHVLNVECVKIGCLLGLFQKKNRADNLKMLLQNNYINNSVTNGLDKRMKEKNV